MFIKKENLRFTTYKIEKNSRQFLIKVNDLKVIA